MRMERLYGSILLVHWCLLTISKYASAATDGYNQRRVVCGVATVPSVLWNQTSW